MEPRVRISSGTSTPNETQASPPSTPPPPAEEDASGSLRVLVVDDNADSAVSMQLLLRRKKHVVETAYDGPEAVTKGAAFLPRVILLDIGLPGMDGCDVAREVRKQPWGADVFLIATTGRSQESDRKRCQEAGFDLYLVKPVAPETLLRLLASIAQGERGTAPR